MKDRRVKARHTARHEAAHALIARLFGVPVEWVDVRPKVTLDHYGKPLHLGGAVCSGDAYTAELNRILCSTTPLTASEATFLRREMHVQFAGPVAEDGVLDKSASNDSQSIEIIAKRLGGGTLVLHPGKGYKWSGARDPEQEKKEMRKAYQFTWDLLVKHEAEWEAVTSGLCSDGRLTATDIDAILAKLGSRTGYEVEAPE